MFEFFIALFGGLFYGGVALSERSNNKRLDKFHDNVDEWKNLLDGCDVMRETERQLTNPDTRWEALNSIADQLKFVYGEGWETLYYSEPSFRGDYRWSQWIQAAQILVAKRGKIDVDMGLYRGIELSFMNESERAVVLRVFQVVEQFIQEYLNINHPDKPSILLYFVPEMKIKTRHSSRKPEIYWNDHIASGKLEWSFCIDMNCKCPPPIKRLW